MTRERDDGLEDPYGCTDPFTGETVHRGTAIAVPYGFPMPAGSTTPNQDGSHAPNTSLYVCQDGRWVGLVSYRESPIQLFSDAMSVIAVDAAEAVMTGRYEYAGETAVALSASVGNVELDEDGCWTWQPAPDDDDFTDVQFVVITATTADATAKVAFELTYSEGRYD